jgi:hypothetical protein
MNETNNPPTVPIERQRMDVDIVGVGPHCGLRSQIVTSKIQPSYLQVFVFSNPVTTA